MELLRAHPAAVAKRLRDAVRAAKQRNLVATQDAAEIRQILDYCRTPCMPGTVGLILTKRGLFYVAGVYPAEAFYGPDHIKVMGRDEGNVAATVYIRIDDIELLAEHALPRGVRLGVEYETWLDAVPEALTI